MLVNSYRRRIQIISIAQASWFYPIINRVDWIGKEPSSINSDESKFILAIPAVVILESGANGHWAGGLKGHLKCDNQVSCRR